MNEITEESRLEGVYKFDTPNHSFRIAVFQLTTGGAKDRFFGIWSDEIGNYTDNHPYNTVKEVLDYYRTRISSIDARTSITPNQDYSDLF